MSETNKRSRLAFVIGVLLGAITATSFAYALFYVTHTVQRDARVAGLPIPVQTMRAAVKVLHESIGASASM